MNLLSAITTTIIIAAPKKGTTITTIITYTTITEITAEVITAIKAFEIIQAINTTIAATFTTMIFFRVRKI